MWGCLRHINCSDVVHRNNPAVSPHGLPRQSENAYGHFALDSSLEPPQRALMRRLLHFNPATRLNEILAGLTAAHLYLVQRRIYLVQRRTLSAPRASTVTLTAILAVVTIHLWLYGGVAYHTSFIGRTAPPLYGPLLAMTIYLVARYDTPWSRLFSQAMPVRLGEVSYSIYLLHEIIPSAFKWLGLMTTDLAVAWVTWVGLLLLLALISHVSTP
jgi:peptidoglycan/LPS O-acetylase OafA/YrhL